MSLTGKLSNQNISNISSQNIYQTRKHKKNIRYNLITYQTLNFLNNCRKIYLEQINTKHIECKKKLKYKLSHNLLSLYHVIINTI